MLPVVLPELTPEYLTEALQAHGSLTTGRVTLVQAKLMDPKATYNAQLKRLWLSYDGAAGAPQTLIAKMSGVTPELQENIAIFQPTLKESWFYGYAASTLTTNVPQCYVNAYDPNTGRLLLILQDLAPARLGDQVVGCSQSEAELALKTLAQLHAHWWEHDHLEELLRLTHSTTAQEQELRFVEQLYERAWPVFVARFEAILPATVRQFGERLLRNLSSVERRLAMIPRTLQHGDFRLENLLFGASDDGIICWVIDWEDIGAGTGVGDVAWFLGSSLPVELQTQVWMLLQSYHRSLSEYGVSNYHWEQCYEDFRYAVLSYFVQGVLTATSCDPKNAHSQALSQVVGERFIRMGSILRLQDIA